MYQILLNLKAIYDIIDRKERRRLMEVLVEEIQIYEEWQPSGQWLKSIRFRLPIIPEDMVISLDNGNDVEAVAGITRFE